jgi:hypothetical protein
MERDRRGMDILRRYCSPLLPMSFSVKKKVAHSQKNRLLVIV